MQQVREKGIEGLQINWQINCFQLAVENGEGGGVEKCLNLVFSYFCLCVFLLILKLLEKLRFFTGLVFGYSICG